MVWRVLDVAGGVLFVADAAGFAVFLALYAVRSRWWSTPAGRVLLGIWAVITAIMTAAVGLELAGDGVERLRLVLRVVLYGLLLGGIVHLIVLLLRAQRADGDRHRADR